MIEKLESFNCNIDVYDPWVNKKIAKNEYDINPIEEPFSGKYDAIIITVAHNKFRKLSLDEIKAFAKPCHVIYDLKYLLNANAVDGRL